MQLFRLSITIKVATIQVNTFQLYTTKIVAQERIDRLTPSQCRAARGLVDMSQVELAEAANVGLSTVKNFEAGRTMPVANNLDAIRRALEARSVQFIPENGGGAGVRLAKPMKAPE